MKIVFITLVLMAFLNLKGGCQQIFLVEIDTQGKSKLISIAEDDTSSYDLDYSLDFDLFNDQVYNSNIHNISVTDLEDRTSELIYNNSDKSDKIVFEIAADDKYCYFTEVNDERFRFDSLELKRINLETRKVEKVILPDSLNFSNITLSPNSKSIAFIHYSNANTDREKYFLMVYDFSKNNLIIVDEANYRDRERFARIDDGSLITWVDSNCLMYFKNNAMDKNGVIILRDLRKDNKSENYYVPMSRIKCFAFSKNSFYFLERGRKLVSFGESGMKKTVYESRSGSFLKQKIILK